MVDSINPLNQIQNISSANNARKTSETEKSDETRSSAPVDEVSLSEDALSLSQAEEAAKRAAEQLANDESLTLSSDEDRLNKLV